MHETNLQLIAIAGSHCRDLSSSSLTYHFSESQQSTCLETWESRTDESTGKEQVMYPLGMDPLMIELCKYHEKLWRKDHPEHDSDFYALDIVKAFLQSAAERGLARLVKGPEGDLIWEATPKIFRDLGELRLPRPP